ncbi:Ethylene-responsive small GTP-binding protein, related [Eimeria brunetti]|uniref:Ethylene-responsive small GTP-binding protein, related n=1 Tax=Eimeria brunetti TaxID=51314 RepID=U6LJI9_9EIME|nr:Ethylene-responsive small GTP-binding protein, related [Eimeria brunetti]
MSYRGGRREKAEPFDHLVKLLVLGDSSVGKSSLLLRFAENKFDPNFVLTIGLGVFVFALPDLELLRVDFKTKVVECGGRRIKLQVWDTAGQERFRTITPAYFRSAMGVMLVYDITNLQTFLNIRRWMQNVEEYADPSIVRVLVANKLDLQAQRQVSRSKGEDLAREYSIPFIETSAKGNVNVEEAFMYVTSFATLRCRKTESGNSCSGCRDPVSAIMWLVALSLNLPSCGIVGVPDKAALKAGSTKSRDEESAAREQY